LRKILITNDDGFEADGLKALVEALKDLAHITIVAPSSEKSACSSSITLKFPLRFISVGDDFYKLEDGTPADCIYLAMHAFFEKNKPDLIISGINKGANLGEDTLYSGTLAGAIEGAINGIPSVAISQVMTKTEFGTHDYSYDNAQGLIRDLVQKIFKDGFPLGDRKVLNINVPNLPNQKLKGVKVTQLGHRLYSNDAHRHTNPRGEEFFWLGLHPLKFKEKQNSDWSAVCEGYASVTPIKLDMTSVQDLDKIKKWI